MKTARGNDFVRVTVCHTLDKALGSSKTVSPRPRGFPPTIFSEFRRDRDQVHPVPVPRSSEIASTSLSIRLANGVDRPNARPMVGLAKTKALAHIAMLVRLLRYFASRSIRSAVATRALHLLGTTMLSMYADLWFERHPFQSARKLRR